MALDIDIDGLKATALAAGREGAPFIEQAITTILAGATGPFGLLVSPALNLIWPMINSALGIDPDTPPAQTAAAIDADPDAAKDKLSALAEDHQFQLALAKQDQDFALQSQGQQTAIAVVEAQNPSWWVGGYRPAAGWVCVIGLGLFVVVAPVISYVLAFQGRVAPPPPDTTIIVGLLGALLGVSTMRSFDKAKGTAFNGVGSGTTKVALPAPARRK